MATIVRCDRCGKEFTNQLGFIVEASEARFIPGLPPTKPLDRYDLCQKCGSKIMRFLRNDEEEAVL